MPKMKVTWPGAQAESNVVNCPYDVVGVYTPAGQTLAGPYTVKVSHDAAVAPTAQTHDGSAIPDLTDGDTKPLGTYGFYPFFTLTATTPPADDTEYCYLIYRDFIR